MTPQIGDLVMFRTQVAVYSEYHMNPGGIGSFDGQYTKVERGDFAIVVRLITGFINNRDNIYFVACQNGLWATHVDYIRRV